MAAGNACNTYLNSHYDGMDPKQLILMLYDGALKFTRLAKEGINEKNIRKRGENIGKVIAIITELNSSLDPNVKDESIDFLRTLYTKMLTELPKVSLDNNIKILDLTESYLNKLREIWVKDVMGKTENTQTVNREAPQKKQPAAPVKKVQNVKKMPVQNSYNRRSNYSQNPSEEKRKSISA